MQVIFLDEFGHIGPFVSRTDDHYKTSPVFGMAGFMLPSHNVRGLSTWFHQLKCDAFADEIKESGKHESHWEKKGNQVFTARRAYKTKRLGFSLINKIKAEEGKVFYFGVEKHATPEQSSGPGLYKNVLSNTIRAIERRFSRDRQTYAIIMDQHNDRAQLMISAQKTMYGQDGARGLMEPPYQVESHLYPSVQMADWISSIVGSLWSYKTRPTEFPDEEWAEKYFSARLASASTHSKVRLKPSSQEALPLTGGGK